MWPYSNLGEKGKGRGSKGACPVGKLIWGKIPGPGSLEVLGLDQREPEMRSGFRGSYYDIRTLLYRGSYDFTYAMLLVDSDLQVLRLHRLDHRRLGGLQSRIVSTAA